MLTFQVIVPEFSATLGFPGERCVPLNGNHLEIAKCVSDEDNNYNLLADELEALVSGVAPPEPNPVENM